MQYVHGTFFSFWWYSLTRSVYKNERIVHIAMLQPACGRCNFRIFFMFFYENKNNFLNKFVLKTSKLQNFNFRFWKLLILSVTERLQHGKMYDTFFLYTVLIEETWRFFGSVMRQVEFWVHEMFFRNSTKNVALKIFWFWLSSFSPEKLRGDPRNIVFGMGHSACF